MQLLVLGIQCLLEICTIYHEKSKQNREQNMGSYSYWDFRSNRHNQDQMGSNIIKQDQTGSNRINQVQNGQNIIRYRIIQHNRT